MCDSFRDKAKDDEEDDEDDEDEDEDEDGFEASQLEMRDVIKEKETECSLSA